MTPQQTEPAGLGKILPRMAALRRHTRWVWWATVILAPVGLGGLLLLVALLGDHYLVLGATMRFVMLLGMLAASLWVLRCMLSARPQTSDEELALRIERHYPQLNNVLINALQLSRQAPEGDGIYAQAVAQEATAALQHIAVKSAVSKRTMAVSAMATALVMTILLLLAMVKADALDLGLGRVFAPYGDNTLTRILYVTPGDTDILLNSDVTITADVGGRVPTVAKIVCTWDDGQRIIVSMSPPEKSIPDRLSATLSRMEQSFRYHIVAGDARSQTFTINVHRMPSITRIIQKITPPPYIHDKPVEQAGGAIRALLESIVELIVHTANRADRGKIVLGQSRGRGRGRDVVLTFDGKVATAAIEIGDKPGRYTIELVSDLGFHGEPVSYDIVPLEDNLPRVRIVELADELTVDIDAQVMVRLRAEDDYALRDLILLKIIYGQESLAVKKWTLDTRDHQLFEPSLVVSVAELGLDEKRPIQLQAVAHDYRPDSLPGKSQVVTIRLRAVPTNTPPSDDNTEKRSLAALITKQRTNLNQSKALLNQVDTDSGLLPLVQRQESIRKDAILLGAARNPQAESRSALSERLDDLSKTLMILAIDQLRRAHGPATQGQSLAVAIDTQKAILQALMLGGARYDRHIEQRPQRDIVRILTEIITRQRTLGNDTVSDNPSAQALALRQKMLARDVVRLQHVIGVEASRGAGGNPTLADQYQQMEEAFTRLKVRGDMLIAASRLQDASIEPAIEKQDEILQDLTAIARLLRDAMVAQARDELHQITQGLSQANKKMAKMQTIQQKITEVAQQLHKTEDLSQGQTIDAEDLQDLVEARRQMIEAVEQLVGDMHLLPDMSASNDLLNEMSELYEDVKQAQGSEDDPISEIAVDRDEGTLAAFKAMQKKMQERMADMEMWLMDKPDTIAWKQESYDRDELGKVPLGDLPDALEDIVGDLVDQAEQLSQEAEDSASNVGFPDATMGWDIMDGPMPSWAAKGKSGNERPNSMEQVGRSGSGRQGKSSGELVGDTLKALEGSSVNVRRTKDGFQAGEVAEEEPGFMDVKATGGGKLAGTRNTEGLSGNAPPRNELKYRDLARRHQQLQRNVETVYSKARLLRLATGELDRALLELDVASRQLAAQDLRGFARSQQQVIKVLRQSDASLTGKSAVTGPSAATTIRQGDLPGTTGEPIPRQYEDAVARYMRRIAQPSP